MPKMLVLRATGSSSLSSSFDFAGGLGEVQEVEDTPEAIQKLVGGYFAEMYTKFGLALLNEDASGLPLNLAATGLVGFPIYGTVLITGGADENGQILDYRGPQGRGGRSI